VIKTFHVRRFAGIGQRDTFLPGFADESSETLLPLDRCWADDVDGNRVYGLEGIVV
jgi:hypothetical protein